MDEKGSHHFFQENGKPGKVEQRRKRPMRNAKLMQHDLPILIAKTEYSVHRLKSFEVKVLIRTH